jgi:acyl-coenzyme A thioesterase PaaI-like protein
MFTLEPFNLRTRENLPGDLGETITHVGKGGVKSELPVRKCLMAPNGISTGRGALLRQRHFRFAGGQKMIIAVDE